MEIMKIFMENLTESVKEDIISIDKTYYLDIDTPSSWYDRYDENTDVILLKTVDNIIVGYLIVAGIKKELFDSFKAGVLVGDFCINPKMFDNNSKYKYLASIVILEKYRSLHFGKLMLKLVFNYYHEDIISIATSKRGYALLNRKFKNKIEINEKCCVFYL